MGGCASKPKALDGQAPEDKPIYTSAPSDVTSAPAEAAAESKTCTPEHEQEEHSETAILVFQAAAESKTCTPEHEQEEHSETAAPVEGETRKDGSSTRDDSGTHQEQEQRQEKTAVTEEKLADATKIEEKQTSPSL
uniref:Uncharacterized protein LOC105052036 n=1 Tax=Elaeis guineensis var. tenera TaxID=51953 RepID=A0A6I9RS16_ELAGV|nr:uncharacterized protein LOC105052036 [Elaeis guineensis]